MRSSPRRSPSPPAAGASATWVRRRCSWISTWIRGASLLKPSPKPSRRKPRESSWCIFSVNPRGWTKSWLWRNSTNFCRGRLRPGGGRKISGAPVGAIGDCGTFSFYPTKNLGACGEGGAFVSKHAPVIEQAQLLRVHGSPKRYTHTEVGFNFAWMAFRGRFWPSS